MIRLFTIWIKQSDYPKWKVGWRISFEEKKKPEEYFSLAPNLKKQGFKMYKRLEGRGDFARTSIIIILFQ